MKKRTILITIAALAVLYTIGSSTESESSLEPELSSDVSSESVSSESPWTVNDDDILPILFHQPYLDVTNITVYCQSERTKMPDQISSTLRETPCIVEYKDGGLSGTDYYAVTSKHSGYYFYVKTKNNKPNGFGILAEDKVDLDNWDSISNMIYAGNFKDGIFHGYGARFNADADTISVINYIYPYLNDNFDEKYIDLAMLYLKSHVVYDGTWENGKTDGKGNQFFVNDVYFLQSNESRIPDGYWGGFLYPEIAVSEQKNDMESGDAKYYINGALMFEGEVKDDKQDGKGTSYFLNGNKKYDGEWKNGKYHGKGKLYDENGDLVYSGKWEKGDYAS